MTPEERAEKIALYERGYDDLVDELQRLPREMWQFKPTPDEWSIHEMIIHIFDSDARAYIRFRQTIAESGKPTVDYDRDEWVRKIDFHQESWEDALDAFRFIRVIVTRLLRRQPEEIWANTIIHPVRGDMTLEDQLELLSNHVRVHIQQMRDNYAKWLGQD